MKINVYEEAAGFPCDGEWFLRKSIYSFREGRYEITDWNTGEISTYICRDANEAISVAMETMIDKLLNPSNPVRQIRIEVKE